MAFAGNPPVLRGVWSDAPDDLFAVGDGGTLARWNGSSWTTTVLDANVTMRALWGNGPDDVLAVGDAKSSGTTVTTIRHWDGVTWSVSTTYERDPIIGISGHARNDVYAFASSGITHWDGQTWSTTRAMTGLNAMWAGAGEVFAAGDSTIWHWEGTRWVSPRSGASLPPLNAVWAADANDAFAVGDGHVVGHWDGVTWSTITVADSLLFPTGSLAGDWKWSSLDRRAGGAGRGTMFVFGGNALVAHSGNGRSGRRLVGRRRPRSSLTEPIQVPHRRFCISTGPAGPPWSRIPSGSWGISGEVAPTTSTRFLRSTLPTRPHSLG